MSSRLQMAKIAALTGYSVSTVSRVLGGKSYTSEKARESISNCARRLGVMDELATGRLLIKGITVFAPGRTFTSQGDIFYQEVVRGIAQAIEPHDVYVNFCGIEEQRSDLKLFLEKVSNKNISAIIFIGIDDLTVFKLATTLNKPSVLINSNDQEMLLDAVSPDHRAICFTALRHCFEQGHRRILSLTSLRRNTYYLRLEGIKEAYRYYHVPFEPQRDLIVTEFNSPEESEEALGKWFANHPQELWPEVIFPANAGMTLGVQRLLVRLGLRVPQDISLITTDSAANLENITANLVSGIAIPCRELGSEAVHLLQNRLNRPQAPIFNLLLQGKFLDAGTVITATRHAGRATI